MNLSDIKNLNDSQIDKEKLLNILEKYLAKYKFESAYINTVKHFSDVVNMVIYMDEIRVTHYDQQDESCDISHGEHKSIHTLISIYPNHDAVELDYEHFTIILQHCCDVYGIMYE